MKSTVKLTMARARKIVKDVFPTMELKKDSDVPGIAKFIGRTGPDGLMVVVENDWFTGDGSIHMTVMDPHGMGHIEFLYNPKTLKRDAYAEEKMARERVLEERIDWVHSMGAEMAHKMVDNYLGTEIEI